MNVVAFLVSTDQKQAVQLSYQESISFLDCQQKEKPTVITDTRAWQAWRVRHTGLRYLAWKASVCFTPALSHPAGPAGADRCGMQAPGLEGVGSLCHLVPKCCLVPQTRPCVHSLPWALPAVGEDGCGLKFTPEVGVGQEAAWCCVLRHVEKRWGCAFTTWLFRILL